MQWKKTNYGSTVSLNRIFKQTPLVERVKNHRTVLCSKRDVPKINQIYFHVLTVHTACSVMHLKFFRPNFSFRYVSDFRRNNDFDYSALVLLKTKIICWVFFWANYLEWLQQSFLPTRRQHSIIPLQKV